MILEGLAIFLAILIAHFLTRSIVRPLAAAVLVAKGDLSADIEVSSKDEVGQLLAALRSMNLSLHELIANIRGSIHHIATASAEIATGNMDLSVRTEQQASSLEETSAATEQIAAAIKHSAENAGRANDGAALATAAASKGGQMVARVVDTMGVINDSSRQIASIIGVIDDVTQKNATLVSVFQLRAAEQDDGRSLAIS
ncbi:HAMP domain-containing protein [Herbaspirillum sp. RV1423]|uniref:HAMP domain-containing protein n=1 Tax=Herbaspirillum sp. RV1423 TaxID=1443993 RepID=UPI001E34B299|nr:HAMP domain-containing protein [Herbaspirillum sp. RV1423]